MADEKKQSESPRAILMSMVNRGRIIFSFMKLSDKNLIIRLKIIFGSNRFFTFQIDEI